MRRLLAIVAIMTLLAACGSGGGSSSDTVGTTEGEAGTATTAAAEEEGSGDGEETLADFFGYGSENQEEAQAQYRDEEARRQELIRACMAEEGFDYTPVNPPEESFQVWGPEDEEERVRTQGFGITTWYGNEEEFGGGFETEWEDPNQEMIDAMSDSEREAYYEALYGTEEEQMEGATTETDPETGEEITMMQGYGAGCEGEASEEIYGDPVDTEKLWQEIQPEMEAMYERVEADPRIAQFNDDWSTCMAEAGYQYESRQNMHETIFEDFQKRLDEIVGPNGGYGDPFEGMSEAEIEEFMDEHTEEEINDFFEQAQEDAQKDVDQDALAALQQEEIDLAVADFECGEGYDELYQEVAAEYEAEFIEANRDTLEQIREAQGG